MQKIQQSAFRIQWSLVHTILLVMLMGIACPTELIGQQLQGTLGQGEIWETPWYVVEGAEPGPTVLVTGGVHGNEPAGAAAAEQIRHWPVQRGKLIVVPRVNRLGLEADTRWFPPDRNKKTRRDLNRNFPTRSTSEPGGRLAQQVWQFVNQHQPEVVIDLHEGFDFHQSNPKSVGSSIIFSKSESRTRLGRRMLDSVNETVRKGTPPFELLSGSGAAQGSLVRACTEQLGADAFILETTTKGQPVSLRTRQHRVMVSRLLLDLKVIGVDCVDRLCSAKAEDVVDVAIYDSAGASQNGLDNLSRILGRRTDISFSFVGPEDIRQGSLKAFDLALFPGGSGGAQGRGLGGTGREQVRSFVRDGGGVIGICAGAYLVSSHYKWSLHMINTAVYNDMVDVGKAGRKSMWYRGGPADVKLEVSSSAKETLGFAGDFNVRYQNGPIVARGKETDLPDYEVLAWFRSENWRYEPQKGTMIDTPAIVAAEFGDGRVLSISPHPESTKELESMIVHSIHWVARQD